MTRRTRRYAPALAAALLMAGIPVGAAGAAAPRYPETIALPTGSQPEGITSGRAGTFYAGARRDGAIVRGSLRTGESAVLVPGRPGAVAVGMAYDRRTGRLWVAGGATGTVTAYDGDTGAELGRWTVPGQRFLNDVALTREAVFVTDSRSAELVVIPLGERRTLPPADGWALRPLGGEFAPAAGFNANGIRALPGGRELIVVQSATGTLYRVDAATGVADVIEVQGRALTSGDGLELRGDTLYVVYGYGTDAVAVLDLAGDARSARVTGEITDADLDRPTTVTVARGRLWAVNGRFAVADDPATTFEVVRLPLG